MADKLSSPSSSSGNGNGSGRYSPHGGSGSRTSSSGNGHGVSNVDDPYFLIRRQPPSYAYSNESFEVEIQLELPKTSSPPTTIWANEPIELAATLYFANSKHGRACGNEAILMTEPMRITMPPSSDVDTKRSCRVRCMIRMDSIRRDTGSVVEVRFAPRQDLSPSVRSISVAATKPIHLVNYKIRISMEEEWESVWYKDEGGRDKSMEVFASMYDKDGQLKLGEQIPLQPVLCYKVDNGAPTSVGNQDILRILGSNRIVVDKDTGRARVRFRVEDVSKNHQGQDFVLQVGPESKSKSFRDIAPAYTPAVNVRSKRNKRSRNSSMPRGVKDMPSGGGGYDRTSPAVSRPRLAYNPDHASAAGLGGESIFGGGGGVGGGGPGVQLVDSRRLRDAMNGIIAWADEVVHGLYPLQWHVLGYAQHPDGTPDYTRPYHNMPNPNGPINRILSLYSDQVRGNMRTLLDAIEQSGTGAAPGAASAGRTDEYATASAAAAAAGDPYSMHAGARAPMHPSLPPLGEASRSNLYPHIGRSDISSTLMPYQARATMPPGMVGTQPGMQMVTPQYGTMASASATATMDDYARMHGGVSAPAAADASSTTVRPSSLANQADEDNRESEVEYVLAKQFKALRTGERLGFPAYSANKEILGFYREIAGKMGAGSFVPISQHRHDFGPLEIMQATEILDDAIAKKSETVHALKDWGSVAALLDHAMVFDWSKDIGPAGNDSQQTSAST